MTNGFERPRSEPEITPYEEAVRLYPDLKPELDRIEAMTDEQILNMRDARVNLGMKEFSGLSSRQFRDVLIMETSQEHKRRETESPENSGGDAEEFDK